MNTMNIYDRVQRILEGLNDGLMEREYEIASVFLSAIAGESIFLIGKPGVAKSLLARKLKSAFKDAKSFEYLMNRFSTPDEIFGPVDIVKLKDEGKYERKIDGYLPDADVVFLDEIWKAGPSIQNALLTVVNEKIYRNGDNTINIPMKALLSASNELPAEGEGLEALWDRFLVRLEVKSIAKRDLFDKMITEDLSRSFGDIPAECQIDDEEYALWSVQINRIVVPHHILEIIHGIRAQINNYNKGQLEKQEDENTLIYISDRRWRKIVRLLRTSAFLNGRNEVDLMDCYLIKDCIWNRMDQINLVADFVSKVIETIGYTAPKGIVDLEHRVEQFGREIGAAIKLAKPVGASSSAPNNLRKATNPLLNMFILQKKAEKDDYCYCQSKKIALRKADAARSLESGSYVGAISYPLFGDGSVDFANPSYISCKVEKGNGNYVLFVDGYREALIGFEKTTVQRNVKQEVKQDDSPSVKPPLSMQERARLDKKKRLSEEIQKMLDEVHRYKETMAPQLCRNHFVKIGQNVEKIMSKIDETIRQVEQLKLRFDQVTQSLES